MEIPNFDSQHSDPSSALQNPTPSGFTGWRGVLNLWKRINGTYVLLALFVLVVFYATFFRWLVRQHEQEIYQAMLDRDKKNNPGVNADTEFDRLFESVAEFPGALHEFKATTLHNLIPDITYLCPVDYDVVGHRDEGPIRGNFADNFSEPPMYQLIGSFTYLNSTTCTEPFEGVVFSLLSTQQPKLVTDHWEVLLYVPMHGNEKTVLRQTVADAPDIGFNFSPGRAPWVINIEPPTVFRHRGVISVIYPTSTIEIGGARYHQNLSNPELDQLHALAKSYNSLVKQTIDAINSYNSTPADQKTQDQFNQVKALEKQVSDTDIQIKSLITIVQSTDPSFDPASLQLQTIAYH